MPLGCPVVRSAPGRPRSIELQATAPSPVPTRAEENITTTPGCGPAGRRALPAERLAGLQVVRLRALARRREPKKTPDVAWLQTSLRFAPSPKPAAPKIPPRPPPAPLAHAGACGGTPRLEGGLQAFRPRRHSARKISPNNPWACRTNSGFQTLNGRFRQRYICAWVPPLEDGDWKDKRLHASVLHRALRVLVLHVSPRGSVGGAACVCLAWVPPLEDKNTPVNTIIFFGAGKKRPSSVRAYAPARYSELRKKGASRGVAPGLN